MHPIVNKHSVDHQLHLLYVEVPKSGSPWPRRGADGGFEPQISCDRHLDGIVLRGKESKWLLYPPAITMSRLG